MNLNPCLFCKSNAVEEDHFLEQDNRTEIHYVECTVCNARGSEARSSDDAIYAWNNARRLGACGAKCRGGKEEWICELPIGHEANHRCGRVTWQRDRGMGANWDDHIFSTDVFSPGASKPPGALPHKVGQHYNVKITCIKCDGYAWRYNITENELKNIHHYNDTQDLSKLAGRLSKYCAVSTAEYKMQQLLK